ncbi:MAG TPA: MFS transporter [Rhabdochlamydiaceae bacterium]|nr:MFS transporter [Rhabdochlamydiaceae bacterium]
MKIKDKNRKWWILAAMSSTISMIFIDITVLPVALPTIQKLLNFSDLALQWIINCYTLTLTILMLAGGRLSDIFGAKKIFCYGVSLFAIASALCGFSNTEWWFIASRVLQGIGGALLIPSTALIIYSSFPPQERGKAMGISVSVGSLFLSSGPFIGGFLTQYASWRYVFWINLPIAAIGTLLALFSVPKSATKRERFDYFGFFTISIGTSALVIGIMQAKHWGWTSPLTLTSVISGLILIFLLSLFDRKVKDPFIDYRLFKNRSFVGAVFSIFCTQFIVMVTIFWTIYFQTALQFTPVEAGTLALLANLPVMLAAPLGGYLLDRFGPRLPITIGYILILGALIWFSQVLHLKSTPMLLSAIIPFGCGIPMIFSPSFNAALHEVPSQKRGMASGLTSTVRQFGSTLGMAIFGALLLYLQDDKFSKALATNFDTENLRASQFEGLLAQSASAMQAFDELPASVQDYVRSSDLAAYMSAFYEINFLTISVAVLGLLVSFFCIKKKLHHKT